jgi:hypothetical protein
MLFYNHINGMMNGAQWTEEQVFNYKVRFQILCQNQEEKDEILGWALAYGRNIQVDTHSEWVGVVRSKAPEDMRLLPIVFTTWRVNLRGL